MIIQEYVMVSQHLHIILDIQAFYNSWLLTGLPCGAVFRLFWWGVAGKVSFTAGGLAGDWVGNPAGSPLEGAAWVGVVARTSCADADDTEGIFQNYSFWSLGCILHPHYQNEIGLNLQQDICILYHITFINIFELELYN